MPVPSYKKKRTSKTASRSNRQQLVIRNPSRFPFRSVAYAADRNKFVMPVGAKLDLTWGNTGLDQTGAADITFAVTQQGISWSINNSAWNSGTLWNNYASAAALFQMYRIVEMEVEVTYSNTEVLPANSGNSVLSMPIVYSVCDREDARSITSASDMLQYASCQYKQAGSGRIRQKMTRPSCYVVNDNDQSLIGTVQASQLAYSPWLACGTNSAGATAAVIPHGYIKFFFDTMSILPPAVKTGVFTFVVRAIFEYRGID